MRSMQSIQEEGKSETVKRFNINEEEAETLEEDDIQRCKNFWWLNSFEQFGME